MGYSDGQIKSSSDSTGKGEKGDPGLPGIGFNLTDDGNFDLDGKRLTDVADPTDLKDAATKGYVDTENSKQDIAIYSKAEKADVLLLDGSQSMKGNLDMKDKDKKSKIINLAKSTNDDEAVNLSQLQSYTYILENNYHLQPSFTFYKNYGDKAQLIVYNINIPDHKHHDLFVANKEGSSPGFGSGWAWLSYKMTNNLASGTYRAIFEIFSIIIISPTNITFLNNETLIQEPDGDDNYKIITFSHDYQTTHSKAFFQFTSNGQPGEITFQFRYYGSSYNNSSLRFLFYSRVIAGKVGTSFDHKIFDVDGVQLRNQILYFHDINMN